MNNHIFQKKYKKNDEYKQLYDEIITVKKLMIEKLKKSTDNLLYYDIVNYQWKLRSKMAKYNEKLFEILKSDDYLILDNNIKTFNELMKNEIENIISSYFNNKVNIIKYDMKELRTNRKILDESLKSIDEAINELKKNYVYVILRNDGMVVNVGRSIYKKGDDEGDLFKALYLSGASGNEKIILSTVYGEEIFDTLRNYNDFAYIIPVDNFEKSKIVEKELGNYLIDNKVPMLNYFSHITNN